MTSRFKNIDAHELVKTAKFQKFALPVAYPLALLAALMLFPDSSAQWEFALVLCASLWLMAWFGHVVLAFFASDGPLLQETLFLKACLGQFVLLIAWVVLSPLIFMLKQTVALPLVLPAAVIALVVALLLGQPAARSSFFRSIRYDDIGRVAFTLFAAACIFKLGAYYSVRAGALGLDTHQHIYFAADLYDAGYLKLNAGASPWIERYPKGLHALTALWGLPGLGDHLGPSLKIMPSLQLLLAVFSFVELCAIWLRRSGVQRSITCIWWVAVAACLAYTLFRGTRFAYPVADLNSTARLSSAAVLLLPGIGGCLLILHGSRRMAGFASFVLPLAGALAVKFNPALAFAFLAVSLPLWLATAGWVLLGTRDAWTSAATGLAGGALVGALLLATDPFYLGLAASSSDNLANLLKEATGLLLLPESVSMGSTSIASLPRLMDSFWHNLTTSNPLAGFQWLPDSPLVLSDKVLTATRFLSCAALVAWILDALFSKPRLEQGGRSASMPALLLSGLLIGGWANGVAGRVVAEVIGTATVEASVLSTYARGFSDILVLFLLPLHLVLAGTLFAQYLSRFSGVYGQIPRWLAPSAGAAVAVLAVSLRWWSLPEAPPAETLGWWHPVKEAQLDAFQRLEKRIPEGAVILADATAARLNEREEWVLPIGDTAAYLPLARRNYIFNVRLGDGYAYSFDDLDAAFCHGTPETARAFVRKHKVRYLFSVDRVATTRKQVLEKEYCGISYAEIGVDYPPVALARDGIAFYEISIE